MWSFVKENLINHPREIVMERIKPLQPLNYNQFRWWRTHTDNVKPLGKRAHLKERIANGDFEPSSYFWMAQLALYTAKDKFDPKTDDPQKQIEKFAVDFARHKRLMEDFEKEEAQRMEALYDAFTSSFKITRDELTEKFLNWPGDIASFYDMAENFFRKSPSENRKRRRGRPPKNEIKF